MIRVRVDRQSVTMGDDMRSHAVEWVCEDDVSLGAVIRRSVESGIFPASGLTPWLLFGAAVGARPNPLALLRLRDGAPQSVSVLVGTTERELRSVARPDADGALELRWHVATVDSAVPWQEFLTAGATVGRGWRHQQAAARRRWWRR